ncbi:PREDICTED: putative disease resistance [Prunus dulcis]|uniref:PREDICTED: putative disease resistance n=1 Tax=Prunus dulcis TaxID=3755 RepID=A0A5E4ELE0_PRUDU|nr:PREDICTED: putative disease resistance [Prunus dulcis]
MAEALVSVVLQQLASITLKQIEEEVNLVVGVDQEVQNLILHLQAVQSLLQDAEERQVKEANVKNWLYNLKDVPDKRHPFEEIKIAQAIIEVLKKEYDRKNSNVFQNLLNCISENIGGKKFLLVLLETIKGSFEKWIAFFDKEKDESKLFDKDIKNKIAEKVDGLPLAAKTLASLMRYKKTRNEWVAVLESKMWELVEVEQQVFQSLLLSYYDSTPAVRRRCLLFCAVFPKDYEFERNELIECWTSQEYLNMKGDREKERMIGQ